MKDVLCKLFGFLKYILLIIAFGLVFYCIMVTYSRLNKPLTDAINVFLPFVLVLIVFVATLVMRCKSVGNNLLFNFVAVFAFVITIIVCLRSIFDTNMLLFYKYGINFNPSFFADNLSAVKAMLYMIFGANVLLIIRDLVEGKKKDTVKKVNEAK